MLVSWRTQASLVRCSRLQFSMQLLPAPPSQNGPRPGDRNECCCTTTTYDGMNCCVSSRGLSERFFWVAFTLPDVSCPHLPLTFCLVESYRLGWSALYQITRPTPGQVGDQAELVADLSSDSRLTEALFCSLMSGQCGARHAADSPRVGRSGWVHSNALVMTIFCQLQICQ